MVDDFGGMEINENNVEVELVTCNTIREVGDMIRNI